MPLLRRHLSTILVAMVTAAVTAGGPAIAATIADFARDAHKVDGKHAVGFGASTYERRGKLVATNGTTGRLPNDIIAKAPNAANAEMLDGKDYTEFLGAQETAWDSDKLDGWDSTDFLGRQETAGDSDKLDGLDSADFAPAVHDPALGYAEIWHDGTIVEGSALNLTQANIVVPRPGIYCFKDLPFTPKNMVAVATGSFRDQVRPALTRIGMALCDPGNPGPAGQLEVKARIFTGVQDPGQPAQYYGVPFTVVFN